MNGMLRTVMRRKVAKYGHRKRRPESSPLLVIELDIHGRRPRTNWIRNIESWTEGGLTKTMDCVRRRQRPSVVAKE